MKNLILIAAFLLGITTSQAALIKGARLDASKKNILIDVVHGGGCGSHDYKLELNPSCLESFPVQCSAKLIHTTDDICEAILSRTAVISIEEHGLTDNYYNGASLTITGDKDWQTGLPTKATVNLPLR